MTIGRVLPVLACVVSELLCWADRAPRSAEVREVSVLVYGATPAGIIAAVTAARQGESVLLVEPGDHVGGMIAGGLTRTDLGVKEVIGGYAAEFFRRVGQHYGEPVAWYFEPHVARMVFDEMLRESGVRVLRGHRLRERRGVRKRNGWIENLTFQNGANVRARVLIDATYEGDLMAQAGVSYTWGREGRSEFDETLAGVRAYTPSHQFIVRLSPFDERGQLLPEVSSARKEPEGTGDRKLQAYNFRLCMTMRRDNRLPVPKPVRYDRRRYKLLERMLLEMDRFKDGSPSVPLKAAAGPEAMCCLSKDPWAFKDIVRLASTKNHKVDVNNYGAFSTDYIGGNYGYADGSYAEREAIWDAHVEYTQGFFYFVANEPVVPIELRTAASEWGLCKDEFTDTKNWPPQLYVREARRMRGSFVMTQRDIQTDALKDDAIGMGSYGSDSHNVQRIALADGTVENEGDVQVPVKPYQIPYRVMLPRESEVRNLLVVTTLSASHVAYSTLRMEPQYMIIGQAAGVAAKLAIDARSSVQAIDRSALKSILLKQGAVLEYAHGVSRN